MAVPELEAMNQVAEALEGLSEQERSRVLRWAAERYVVALPGSPTKRRESVDDLNEGYDEDANEGGGGRASAFEHFAELYEAVDPRTNQERVLVAAYWVQEIQGEDTFQSASLNKLLKDLGHGVTSINKLMSANIDQRPSLILQVRKSSSAQQARKTYKVTDAGKKWVKERLS